MSTQQIAIERFIPIPTKRGCMAKYPLRKLVVSESFLVPCDDTAGATQRLYNSLTSCAAGIERSTGYLFTMRRVKGGIRVWRIR